MNDLVEPYTIAWASWAIGFIVIEGFALARKGKGDTLSEHVWRLFSVRHEGRAVWARRAGLWAGMAWLAAHFVTGGAV